jgi:hypothetical protein
MKHFSSLIVSALVLGSSPAWAQYPTALPAVVVTNGNSATLQNAPSSINNRYYPSVEVQRGGEVVLIERQNIRNLTVRSGGTLRFAVAGAAVAPPLAGATAPPVITIEPGATVEVIIQPGNGLPFAQGYTTIGGTAVAALPYSLAISPDAYYTYDNYDYNTSTGSTNEAPAPTTLNGGLLTVANGIALPATVARFKGSGFQVKTDLAVSQELSGSVSTAAGTKVTLLSSASGTALLIGSSFQGTLAVQRYIDGSRNAGPGYRHVASPLHFQGRVSDFTTANFTPTVNPDYNTNPAVPAASFPTVFGYTSQRLAYASPNPTFDTGWYSPDAPDSYLLHCFGYAVNMPAGGTMTFTGQYTPISEIYIPGLYRNAPADAGWYLLGNPFPAPLDWDKVAANGLTDISRTLYIFKSSGQYTGSYASYVPGVGGINGGNNVLPIAQGFFVRTTSTGSSNGAPPPAVTFRSSQLFTSYDATKSAAVQRTTADARPRLRLSLHDAAGQQAHETLVYFEPAATPGSDAAYDAEYLPGAGQPLSLVSETAGQAYGINGLPALNGADVAVPLRLAAATAGTYTLRTDELANLPAGYHAYLLDAGTGTRLDLAATPSLALPLAANVPVASRYSLLFTTRTALAAAAPAALAGQASLYPNPAHASATLLLPAAVRAGQATPVQVLNSLGQVVRTAVQPAAAAELVLPLDGLAPGLYTVQAHTAVGTISRRLTVD